MPAKIAPGRNAPKNIGEQLRSDAGKNIPGSEALIKH
jgi:hypothetical protein